LALFFQNKINSGELQIILKRIERVRNIRGKLAVNPKARLCQNSTYLIFDNVFTTGSILKEAIKILKKGIKKVYGLTIAR